MQNTIPMVGCGFRLESHHDIMRHLFAFDVLEIMVDHYLAAGYRTRKIFQALAKERPIILHGVNLSIGSVEKPSTYYLSQVAKVIDELQPIAYGEHLAFTKALNIETAHLLPLPRNTIAIELLVDNIKTVKQYIHIPFMLENVAYYFDYPNPDFSEVDFINAICQEADIAILLDIENLRINAYNNAYDAYAFIDKLATDRVRCIHMAGGEQHHNLQLDTHDQKISSAVYELLTYTLKKTSPQCIILERDGRLEYFDEIISDCNKIKAIVAAERGASYAIR